MDSLFKFFNFAKNNLVAILFLVAIVVTVAQNNNDQVKKGVYDGSTDEWEEGGNPIPS